MEDRKLSDLPDPPEEKEALEGVVSEPQAEPQAAPRPSPPQARPESLPGVPEGFGAALPGGQWPPHGRAATYVFAGFDPRRHVREDGTLSPLFESEEIIRIYTPRPLRLSWPPFAHVTRIACHSRIGIYLRAALEEVVQAGLWPYLETYGGGFEPRLIRGGTDLSMHTLGLAFDFDPLHNPLGAPPEETLLGGTADGQRVVRIFTAWGFLWGGCFSGRKDCMHFQWVTGC